MFRRPRLQRQLRHLDRLLLHLGPIRKSSLYSYSQDNNQILTLTFVLQGDPYRGGPGDSGGSGSGGTTYVGTADRKPVSATLYTAAISFSVLFQLL